MQSFHSFVPGRGGDWCGRALKEYLSPLFDQVLSRCGSGFSLPHVLIEAAAASERKPASSDLEPVYAAVHLACSACEPADEPHLRCAESEQVDGVAQHSAGSFQSEEPDPQRAEQFRAGRDHDLAADAVGERIPDGTVQRDAALQKYFLPHVTRSLDSI
jgi:hypothetical protein